MATIPSPFSLTKNETVLFNHLDNFAQQQCPPIECRIAGGWVRDKLLSLQSHDIDVALSDPSGHSFAVAFVQYLQTQGVDTGSIGKVKANPEQSKHLETGTTRIMGLECDFVGLRNESYAETPDSRIPQTRPGTPSEDAFRRDLTINALFYNVHTREIEDYTRGLNDLAKRVARTPLRPHETFHDDPLRVLRCVRFASRFNLTIADEVCEAMQEQDIRDALKGQGWLNDALKNKASRKDVSKGKTSREAPVKDKLSRERIGIEISKMMRKEPLRAIELIVSLGLHASIFDCGIDVPRQEALSAARILSKVPRPQPDDEVLWFAAVLSPFRNTVLHGDRDHAAASVILGNGLKLDNETRKAVTNLFSAAQLLNPHATGRAEIGMILSTESVRPWRRSVTWATVSSILAVWTGDWDGTARETLELWLRFVKKIEDFELPSAMQMPILIDGKRLQVLLNIKPSPLIDTVLHDVRYWQLDHPTDDRDECASWIKSKWTLDRILEWETQEAQSKATGGEKRKR